MENTKRFNIYSLLEEIINSVTHGVGAIAGLAVCIFFLIKGTATDMALAGSYSPLTLIGMRNGGEPVWAWVIFSIVWLAAIIGTGLSFRKMKAQSYLETACYVLMGLTILIAFKPFYHSCGLKIVLWVVGEGIAYITGAILYSFKKIPYIHSVFHIFVMLGDLCHMIATWKLIQMFIS